MDRDSIIAGLGQDWEKMKELLHSSLSSDVSLLDDLNADLLSNTGKMLRPLLTLYVARMCNGGILRDESIRNAAAVEILHNATLLHDDVADEAMLRRGAPTVMSKLGPVPAVLVGDFWLASAVALLSDSSDLKWTIAEFARTLTDLAEGEMLQQQKAFLSDTTIEDYLRIIYCKTGSLFVTACETGAQSVGASREYLQAAGRYGRALGIAFQIRDDILDYAGGETTGKPVGIDLKEQKITLPLLGALSKAKDEKGIREKIHDIRLHPDNCELIRSFVLENGGVEYAEEKQMGYVEEAIQALSVFPDCREKEVLEFIARHNAVRTK
jgi:octaprenyl-diphosphate synthase